MENSEYLLISKRQWFFWILRASRQSFNHVQSTFWAKYYINWTIYIYSIMYKYFCSFFIYICSMFRLTLIKDSTAGLSIKVFKNIISVSLALTWLLTSSILSLRCWNAAITNKKNKNCYELYLKYYSFHY